MCVCIGQESALGDIVRVGDQGRCGIVVTDVGHDVGFWAVGIDDPAVYEWDAGLRKEVEFARAGCG